MWSGNAVRYKHPVYKDANGKIVDYESFAFGCRMTIIYVHVDNVFVLNETGDKTHDKYDGNWGSQRKVVPRGKIPKDLAGVKDSHYTVTPITDAMGTLRFVTVIFAAKEVSPEWSLGIDIFVEWDPDNEFNMGPGKAIDGKKIPVQFADNPKASMTSTIMMEKFQKVDKMGITQWGVDKNRSQYIPAAVNDGHISHTGKVFWVT
jgi:hypothetical protein